ncbi:MAG: FHA domain-containing protein [Lachnospiraceae bacterium]|nr:FHA domain-containing protein [Lachnospiraceae bacterium]
METIYKRSLHKSYMCIRGQEKTVEEYELKILEGEKIPYLLQMQTAIVDGEQNYLYEISGKQKIEDYLSGKKIDYKMFRNLLFAITKLCCVLAEYLLREEGIRLEPEYIYISLENERIYFTYLPFWQKNLTEAFGFYMEQMLRKIDHQDQLAVELAYHVYQMCGTENLSIREILEDVIKAEKRGEGDQKEEQKFCQKADKVERKERGEERGRTEEKKRLMEEEEDLERQKDVTGRKIWRQRREGEEVKRKNLVNIEERMLGKIKESLQKKKERWNAEVSKIWQMVQNKTEVLSFNRDYFRKNIEKNDRKKEKKEEGKGKVFSEKILFQETEKSEESVRYPTEILKEDQQKLRGKLAYQGIHGCEDLVIAGEEFLVGKSVQQAEGIIEGEGVSRLHARITRQKNTFYIEDLNSTNGTYLNEVPLEYCQKKELCKNDHIRFGGEEYVFY